MATEQPCDREALALQPFTDDDMARVSQWLAALPLAECIILAGDGDHVTTDMIGIRWSEDQAEGRWSCRLPTCSKAYLQHFIAYLRCAASWTQHTVHATVMPAVCASLVAATEREQRRTRRPIVAFATAAVMQAASASSTYTMAGECDALRLLVCTGMCC